MFDFKRQDKSKIASWWRNIDKQLLFCFFFLFLMGLFFSFSSTSSVISDKLDKQTYFFFIKHSSFVLISATFLILISIQERKTITSYLIPLFILSLIFLILVPFFGDEVKGSKRWLSFGILPRFQPIELVKPFLILILASIISKNGPINNQKGFVYSLIILTFILILLFIQPDIGQSILISATWLIMIFVSGINIIFIIVISLLLTLLLFLILYFYSEKFNYIILRLESFIDPSKGDNFQSQKALDSIKMGGLTGRGLGEGILKDKVPEAHTDYIIAVIAEEFGIILVIFLILIFLFIAIKIINKIFIENEEFVKVALTGLMSLLIIQVFIHVGVNIRLMPTTGMTMPFLSYGGSSLIGSSIVAGIILNYTKRVSKL